MTVRVPEGEALMLAVHGPRHLYASLAMGAGAVPPSVQLAAMRGGFVHGKLETGGLLDHVHVAVGGIREGEPSRDVLGRPRRFSFRAAVEPTGTFRSPPLEAGRYHVGILLRDAIPGRATMRRVPDPIPMLSKDEFALPPVTIDVEPGAERLVDLAVPVCGELTGRVMAGGEPIANAIVCAEGSGPRAFPPLAHEGPGAYEYRDHCRSDAEGRFRFLVGAPGSFEISARLPNGAYWSEPTELAFPTTGTRLEHDFTAAAAAIRGTLGTIPWRHPRRLTIELHPLHEARDAPPLPRVDVFDPKWVSKAFVAESRPFAFEGLPSGRWVLRVVAGDVRTEFWGLATTTDGEVTALEPFAPPRTVPVEIACVLPARYAIVVRQRVPDSEHEVFVARVWPSDGRLDLGALPPGGYRLHSVHRWEWVPTEAEEADATPEVRDWIDLEVLPDGTCVPDRIDFVKGR